MIRKIAHILIGWGKRFGIIQISKPEAKMAQARKSICNGCEFAQEKTFLRFINGGAEEQKAKVCMRCGCPIWEKTLVVDEQCPIGKW